MRSLPWLRIGLAVAVVVAASSLLRACSASDRAAAADRNLEASRDSTREFRELYEAATERWEEGRAAWLERERELAADTLRLSQEVAEARMGVGVAVAASDVAGSTLDDAIGILVEVAPPDLSPVVNAIVDARAAQKVALTAERDGWEELEDRLTRRGDSLAVLLQGVAGDRDAALAQVEREQELRRNVERDLELAIAARDAHRDAARMWRIGGAAAAVAAAAVAMAVVF